MGPKHGYSYKLFLKKTNIYKTEMNGCIIVFDAFHAVIIAIHIKQTKYPHQTS